jgi:hypothetical protein
MTESITKVGGDLRSLSVGVEGSCKLGEDLLLELVIFGIGSMKIPPLIMSNLSSFSFPLLFILAGLFFTKPGGEPESDKYEFSVFNSSSERVGAGLN